MFQTRLRQTVGISAFVLLFVLGTWPKANNGVPQDETMFLWVMALHPVLVVAYCLLYVLKRRRQKSVAARSAPWLCQVDGKWHSLQRGEISNTGWIVIDP